MNFDMSSGLRMALCSTRQPSFYPIHGCLAPAGQRGNPDFGLRVFALKKFYLRQRHGLGYRLRTIADAHFLDGIFQMKNHRAFRHTKNF